jgi:hypothetical protein
MRRWTLSLAAGVAILAASLEAHHAIGSIYDSSKPMTLEGVVVDFQFISPHPFVVVDVVDRSGRKDAWRLEMDNRGELTAVGMRPDTLKKGDRVVVTGGVARDQSRALYIRRLDRPADGFWYEQAGSSPKTGTIPRLPSR